MSQKTKRLRVMLLCGAYAAFFALGISAESFSLTLEQAMTKVVQTNPEILGAKQASSAAEARMGQAKGDFLPTVTLAGSVGETHTKTGNVEDSSTPRSAGVTARQNLFTGGRTSANYRVEQLNHHAAKALEIALTQRVLLSLVQTYLDVLKDKEILTLNEGQVTLLAKQLNAAEARFEAGEATLTDVKQAEARLAGAEAQKVLASGNLSITWAKLNQILGSQPTKISWPKLPKELPPNLAEAKSFAQKNHPDVLAAKSKLEAAKEGIVVAKSSYYPTLAAAAGVNIARDAGAGNQSAQNVALELSLPLFRGFKTQQEVLEARAQEQGAFYEWERFRRAAEQATVDAFMTYLTSKQTEISFQKSVEANLVAVEGVNAEQEEGIRTVLDVLNAEQELLQARVNLVEAKAGNLSAAYGLLFAMGKLGYKF